MLFAAVVGHFCGLEGSDLQLDVDVQGPQHGVGF